MEDGGGRRSIRNREAAKRGAGGDKWEAELGTAKRGTRWPDAVYLHRGWDDSEMVGPAGFEPARLRL